LQCVQNGISQQEFLRSPDKVTSKIHYLEMFFNGFPTIMHMEKFPYLTELKIIAQDLTKISGLDNCFGLSELWIAECKLKVILSFIYLNVLFLFFFYRMIMILFFFRK
jgi:hypothetical protein